MFGVLWSERSLDELAHYWTEANSLRRTAINESVKDIDRTLQHEPLTAGEFRGSRDHRIYFSSQLAVVYDIHAEVETVWVLRVTLLHNLGAN